MPPRRRFSPSFAAYATLAMFAHSSPCASAMPRHAAFMPPDVDTRRFLS